MACKSDFYRKGLDIKSPAAAYANATRRPHLTVAAPPFSSSSELCFLRVFPVGWGVLAHSLAQRSGWNLARPSATILNFWAPSTAALFELMLTPSASVALFVQKPNTSISSYIYLLIDLSYRSDTESEAQLVDCGRLAGSARCLAGGLPVFLFINNSARLSFFVHKMGRGILCRRVSVIFDLAFRVGLMTARGGGVSTKHEGTFWSLREETRQAGRAAEAEGGRATTTAIY